MKLLLWIALKLRLRQKFWADLFMKYYKKQVQKATDSIDIDVKDIKIVDVESSEFYKKTFLQKKFNNND